MYARSGVTRSYAVAPRFEGAVLRGWYAAMLQDVGAQYHAMARSDAARLQVVTQYILRVLR